MHVSHNLRRTQAAPSRYVNAGAVRGGQKRERVMGDGEGMDPTGTDRPGMDVAELAAEHADLLPERITLTVLQNGQSVGTGNNSSASSSGGNNVVSGNSSMVQTVGNSNSWVQSNASGGTFINQR
jgi:deoxycytidylate deaminase